MSELHAAIKYVGSSTRPDHVWSGHDFAIDYDPAPIDDAIATVLNAVVSGALVPAPAVPEDVAGLVERLIWARDNDTIPGMMREYCGEAAAAIKAQAAELERIRSLAGALVNHPGWGTVNYTDGDMWADADKLRDALTHPTGDTGA